MLILQRGEKIVAADVSVLTNLPTMISFKIFCFDVDSPPMLNEIEEAKILNANTILENGEPITIKKLISLINGAKFIIANDTGPAHMTAHLGSKGIALFGSHTTPFKVSIERENFKAIQAPELSKLSVEKVFNRISSLIS